MDEQQERADWLKLVREWITGLDSDATQDEDLEKLVDMIMSYNRLGESWVTPLHMNLAIAAMIILLVMLMVVMQ